MKLATWNVNSLTVRLPQVLDWLSVEQVDALVLQELKMTDEKFPFLLDCATSVTQRGKIEVYAKLGKKMPKGWRPWCASMPDMPRWRMMFFRL